MGMGCVLVIDFQKRKALVAILILLWEGSFKKLPMSQPLLVVLHNPKKE